MACARKCFADLDDAKQLRIHYVIAISSIKTVIAVRPVGEETDCAELTQLVLNSVKSEPAHVPQFTHVTLFWRRGEEQSQQFGSHLWK